MAVYNYTDTAATKINLNLTTQQAKALSRFITAHGGGESSYSTVVKAYTAIKDDAEFSLKYGNFDEPVEYDVDFISQEDAKANRDELAERDMVVELEDEIPF